MAERRPVTAPEIRQAVEGYSGMNEDAFARRFYADRAELESLGIIDLSVDKPLEGQASRRATRCRRRTSTSRPSSSPTPSSPRSRPPCRCSTASSCASRCGSRSSSSRGAGPARCARRPGVDRTSASPPPAGQNLDLSQRLVKIDTAISRRKTITLAYYTMDRDETGERKVDPYQLLFQGGQFYVVGRSPARRHAPCSRLSRIRGKVAYATRPSSTTSSAPTTSIPASTPTA